MSTHQSTPKYRLYPAYCFRASPTFNAWVKLTAADVLALRSEPAFQSQHIYFHFNHPIRYVRIVGAVVAIDDINLKYTVLTLDDGSGATIEIRIVRLTPDVCNPVDSSSNTTIDNVDVINRCGVFEVAVNDEYLAIGTVVKVKGTISEFRGVKQLDLKRIWIVRTTNEEAQAWAEAAATRQGVLSKPWYISSTEHKKIKKEIKMERKRLHEYKKLKIEHELRKEAQREAREEHRALRDAKLEVRRRREEVMMNAGALI